MAISSQETSASACPIDLAGADLVDPALYSDGGAVDVWRRLRQLDGLSWHQAGADRGFWSVVKYADADLVLRDTATFTSERGTLLDLLGTDDPAGGQQLAVTDPPRHTRRQARLKKALAVKAIDQQREMIRLKVIGLLEPLGDGGVFDFGAAMMALPMSVTGMMMGLPEQDWPWLARLTTVCIAADDPEFQDEGGKDATLTRAHRELFGYFQDLVRHRRGHPGGDLLSVLISTQFEGRRMTAGEVVANCYSLLLGANVTTPHAPSFAMAELPGTGVLEEWAAHPEVGRTALEEALRWASPVNHVLRYATRDTVVRGTRIADGDGVVVWLGAANRDEEVFGDSETFDIRRQPNKHLAFGIGPHYCVGHSVARVTVAVLFDELFGRYEDFRLAGEPQRLISTFASGYKHVPITARQRGPGRARPGAGAPGGPGTASAWFPANPSQKGLWVLERVEQLRPTSLIPTIMEFTGAVRHELLVTSVGRVLARHPALRSRFRLNPARQHVEYRTDGEPADAGFIDAVAEGWSAEELARLVDLLCYTPFDLAEEPPARAEVIRAADERTLLVLTVHHIVCDGQSRSLIMAEIAELYRAALAGAEPALTSPAHPSEVITMIGPDEQAERVAQVVARLRGAPTSFENSFRRDTRDPSLAGGSRRAVLDEDLTGTVLTMARSAGCTPFMTGIALLAGTFARAGDQRDFLFAFGWPGRDDPAAADAVGMFMNTVMTRITLGDATTWRELLGSARAAAMAAFVDGDVPLDAVTAGLKPKRDVIWPPLSPILVNLAQEPADMTLAPGVTGQLRPLPTLHMKYELGLFVSLDEQAGRPRLRLAVDYLESVYSQDAITGLIAGLERSAADLAHSPDQPVTMTSPDRRSTP